MNYEDIKKLIDDMGTANIDELEIEFPEGMKISMKKNTNKQVISSIAQTGAPTIQVNNENNIVKEETKCEENYKVIKSPMVGTFYSKPSPDKDAFVKVGDSIKKGTVVCIVEAMKLMNEIESEFDGEVVEICVNDGDVVEYGMPLFKIK
ncbi:MAG: acetyl-CoA carboxylase biotin carboxyl carrier protein [Clostridia bacterium]|nr:acetyl-CoA carboxylase biotin carboxyl carrier protein [Clostridia bacterium]